MKKDLQPTETVDRLRLSTVEGGSKEIENIIYYFTRISNKA